MRFLWYAGWRTKRRRNRERGQEGEEEKEKMKKEESKAEYMVRSNAAFSGETKFTLPYSSACASVRMCVCVVVVGVSSPLGRVTPNL